MDARNFCTLTFVCGICCHRLSPTTCLGLITVLALLLLWHPKLRTGWILLVSLTCLAVGLGRAVIDDSGKAFETVSGGLTITGSISEPPRKWGRSSVFFFKVDTINGERVSDPCKLLVSWSQCEQTLAPGDRWSLSGRFSRGEPAAYPGAFDLTHWLWSQGAVGQLSLNRFSSFHFIGPPVGHTPHQLAYRARESMMRKLQKISYPDSAALVAGVVFGETQSLPKALQEQFRRTGTSHLLAASGMNVALLAGLVLFAGKVCGYGVWRVAPWAVPPVVGYAFLGAVGIFSPVGILSPGVGQGLNMLRICSGEKSNLDKDALGERDGRPARGDQERLRRET